MTKYKHLNSSTNLSPPSTPLVVNTMGSPQPSVHAQMSQMQTPLHSHTPHVTPQLNTPYHHSAHHHLTDDDMSSVNSTPSSTGSSRGNIAGTSSRMKSPSLQMSHSTLASPLLQGSQDTSLDHSYVPPTEGSVSPPPNRTTSKRSKRSNSDEALCAVENCKRKGTRLVTSLRYEYRLKPHGSNKICEGHYRKDLRRYKKTHPDPLKKTNTGSAQKAQPSPHLAVHPPHQTPPQMQPIPIQKPKHSNRSDLVPLGKNREQKSPMQVLAANAISPQFASEDEEHGRLATKRSPKTVSEHQRHSYPTSNTSLNSSPPRPGSIVPPKLSFQSSRKAASEPSFQQPQFHNGAFQYAAQHAPEYLPQQQATYQFDDVHFSKFCQIVLRYEGMIQ